MQDVGLIVPLFVKVSPSVATLGLGINSVVPENTFYTLISNEIQDD